MASALSGLRVVEVGEGKALAQAGKLLRDLGAGVVKAELPGGDALRRYGPFPGGKADAERSGLFIYLNGGKRGARLDLDRAGDLDALRALLRDADVLLHSLPPARAAALGLTREALAAVAPRLVVASVTLFGARGPYAEWRGYALHAAAGSGLSCRNGAPDREPFTTPLDGIELTHGAAHAAAAVLLALLQRDRTGQGQAVDASALEAATVFISGPRLPAAKYEGATSWQRAGRLHPYRSSLPGTGLVRAADGDYQITHQAPRELKALLALVGAPVAEDDARFATLAALRQWPLADELALHDRIEEWTRTRTKAEIWEQTRAVRSPAQPVLTIPEVCESDQLAAREFFVEAPGPHPPLRVPGPPYRLSATPWRPPGVPPRLDEPSTREWSGEPFAPARETASAEAAPLEGLRVLDLTQVWSGPLVGRALADFGADVILVETASRPRWRHDPSDPTAPLAWESLYRNRRSVVLNLKHDAGRALFLRLVRASDVVLENFSSRAMVELGLGYAALAAMNPHVVMLSMPATGSSGPWSDLLTYGSSLAALYGIKSLMGYPDSGEVMQDPADLDPMSAAHALAAIFAALLHRNRTGEGQHIELAQGETALTGMAEAVIEHFWSKRDLGPVGNTHRVLAPHGFYPCAGDDRWVGIACGWDAEWQALANAAGHVEWLGRPEFATVDARRAARAALDAAIGAWTRGHDAMALARTLQAAGVAAFPIQDFAEIVDDPHHAARRDNYELAPEAPLEAILNGTPWHLSDARARVYRPAPAMGRDTEAVLGELVGLKPKEVARLRGEGAIG